MKTNVFQYSLFGRPGLGNQETWLEPFSVTSGLSQRPRGFVMALGAQRLAYSWGSFGELLCVFVDLRQMFDTPNVENSVSFRDNSESLLLIHQGGRRGEGSVIGGNGVGNPWNLSLTAHVYILQPDFFVVNRQGRGGLRGGGGVGTLEIYRWGVVTSVDYFTSVE